MDNLTPRAHKVLALAPEEAARFHHNYIGTEHLLLGLIRLEQGVAANVLGTMGIDPKTVRTEVEKQIGTGTGRKIIGGVPWTPRVKKALALASAESVALNHCYVGTEHILLGLLREGDGVACHVLHSLGMEIEKTRQEILKELDPDFSPTEMDAMSPEMPQNSAVRRPQSDAIDTSKRYDVYCSERDQRLVVYRNARFKGRRKLLSTGPLDLGSEFLELEQSNGQIVYLSLHSVLKFCEHGTEIVGEIIPPD